MPYDMTKPLFVTATTAMSMLSGLIFGISFLTVPTILQNGDESNILRQWRHLYELGKGAAPPFALVSALAALGSAYTHHHPQAPFRSWMFSASALTTLSIVPFTIVIMNSTNSNLQARDDNAKEKSQTKEVVRAPTEETKSLLGRWRLLNTVRGFFPLAGALLAFEAL